MMVVKTTGRVGRESSWRAGDSNILRWLWQEDEAGLRTHISGSIPVTADGTARKNRESVNHGLAVLVFRIDLLNRPEHCLF